MSTDTAGAKDLVCRVCGNVHNNKRYLAKEMMFGLRDEFEYFECGNCQCVQIREFPADMSKYYPDNYYSYSPTDGGEFRGLSGSFRRFQYSNSLFGSPFYEATLGKLIDKVFFHEFKRINLQKTDRVLDVGCGSSRNFLYPLREMGFENLLGCDPFLPEDIIYDNQLQIKKGNIQEIEGKWNLITYHHSFEHVPNPQEHLHHVADRLDEDGICVIRVPVADSYAWEHYGVYWAQLDAPRHFFLHTEKSMRVMAEKAGLELFDAISDSGHFQFTGSELYKRDIALNEYKDRNLVEKLKRKSKKSRYKKMARQLNKQNKGDQAAFYLRKTK